MADALTAYSPYADLTHTRRDVRTLSLSSRQRDATRRGGKVYAFETVTCLDGR